MKLTPTLEVKHQVGVETITLTFRHPAPQELSDYLRSEYVTEGARIVNHVSEARLALADRLLLDVRGLEFTSTSGVALPIGPDLEIPEVDRAEWSKHLGLEVKTWKDLIPAMWKIASVTQMQINGWATPGGAEAAPAVP